MSGILILEGADAAGKTTLAQYLRDRRGARYIHCGIYKDVWKSHLAAYRRAERLASEGHLVVVDRHWISEYVYGDAYRGGAAYPVAGRCFDRLWLRSAAVTVLCVPSDLQRQWSRHGERYDREYVADLLPAAVRYRDLLRGHPGATADYLGTLHKFHLRPDILRYDVDIDGDDMGAWVHSAMIFLESRRRTQYPSALDYRDQNFGGHAAFARWCLVDEAPSHRAPFRCRYPFVDREENLSAATHLNRALTELGVSETDIIVVNAVNRDLSNLSQFNPTIQFVAIGKKAATVLTQAGIKHTTVPHPRVARHFRYTEILREVLK